MLLVVIALVSLLASVGICWGGGLFAAGSWPLWLPVSWLGCFLGLGLCFFLVLWIACALVDQNKPQEKDSAFFRTLAVLVASAAIPIVGVRVKTSGLEKIPRDGRFLLVCNHLADLDPVILLYYFRKHKISFISKRENATMFIVGKVMHKLRCPLVNRENDREALKTILRCIQLIKDDECSIGVFPEGYIHDDSLLHPFRGGVFKIAQKANVPVVVCTLQNTQYAFKNAPKLKRTTVHLHLVDVIGAEELKGVTALDVAHRAYKLMADDLGPDLVKQNPETT